MIEFITSHRKMDKLVIMNHDFINLPNVKIKDNKKPQKDRKYFFVE